MHRRTLALFCISGAIAGAALPGCANKTVLGDRAGYQEVDTVQTIAEARKAVQWVQTDLEGYEPRDPEAVRARDEVLVQWSRVRDRAEELQARLDGMTAERRSGGADLRENEFYESAAERSEVLRRETSRLLEMWATMNGTFRTEDEGAGSRQRRG